ncbi:pilus assembly protein PilM [Halarsenatibacter silvermanii]|uniref:Type IV pilus assembly protein PilM n=1 Tax=Halarsenatibacter silvermanii TaxID=321763 RepID=A0A1G9JZV5_9FIRM|nr:pilus assembly protein PilM [Halarsenatibacter silvermanii]SDL42766.1 hypothetical protein SAMN04488692_104128 [Halarsenatibacter silvermanii]
MFSRKNTCFIFFGRKEILKVTAFKNRKNKLVVKEFFLEKLSKGAAEEKAFRAEDVSDRLKMLKNKSQEKINRIIAVLPEESSSSKFFQMPVLSRSETRDYLDVEAERMTEYRLNDAMVDYSVINKDAKKISLHLAAVKKETIKSYRKILWRIYDCYHEITLRADLIWPLINELSQRENIILLEVYQDKVFLSAGGNNEIYFYLSRTRNKRKEEPEYFVKEADEYFRQEIGREPPRKVYVRILDDPSIKTPQLSGGYRWCEIPFSRFQFAKEKMTSEFLNLNSPHLLAAVGGIYREI